MSIPFAKYQALRKQWNEFSHLTTFETSQRTEDIESMLATIEAKIQSNDAFTSGKQKLLVEQINVLQSQISSVKGKLEAISNQEKENIESSKEKCQENCDSLRMGIENDNESLLVNSSRVMTQIKQNFEKQCILSTEEMNREKKQIHETRDFIQKQMNKCFKSQSESLDELYVKVGEEMAEIYGLLELRKALKRQKEQKLKVMSQQLLIELQKGLRKEQKFGKLTYECLLKLIQDFHIHIKGKNIRY